MQGPNARSRLIPLSGVTGKGPACFLLEHGNRRLLLDVGVGPDAGVLPDLSAAGRIDAVLLSHAHADHAGGLSLLAAVGNPPVYATAITAAQMAVPGGRPVRPLPLIGRTEVCGIPVATGRNGHSPGGVWLHLAVGDGLFYAGDMGFESDFYAVDPPPGAATAVIDASAGLDDTPQAERRAAMAAALGEDRQTLVPVPVDGRGPEIALFVVEALDRRPALCAEMREAVANLGGPWRETLRPGAADRLSSLLSAADPLPSGPRGIVIAGNVMADGGASAALLPIWRDHPEAAILLTGYVPAGTPIASALRAGRATVARWNVHARPSDNAGLLRALGARAVIPAFNGRVAGADWRALFPPAAVAFGEVEL